tara:strand:+ start:19 stop:444 length:426 start_codon:yes stop_codon:yes gene_type:complete
MEDFFRPYFLIVGVAVGWIIFNESLDSLYKKLFSRRISKRAESKSKELKNEELKAQDLEIERERNFKAIGIKDTNEGLKEYLELQRSIHNECLDNLSKEGLYALNLQIRLKNYGTSEEMDKERVEAEEEIIKISTYLDGGN